VKTRNYPGSPIFHVRLKEEMYEWFRDYANRQSKPMGGIIKEYLEELWHKDEHAPRRAQRETTQ